MLRGFRFELFEVDARTGELRKGGVKIRLQGQTAEMLLMLLERPGELVTRDEFRQKLWPQGTFVDFDHGLNAAVNRLRARLGETAGEPRFIETLPGRGYRFIAPVEILGLEPLQSTLASAPEERKQGRFRWPSGIAIVAAALAVALVLAWIYRGSAPTPHSVAVLPLENLSHDPDQQYLADGITEALTTELGRIGDLRVSSRTSSMHYAPPHGKLPQIAKDLNVQYVIEGAVARSGNRVRVTAQLIEAAADRHVWAESYERDLGDVLSLEGEIAKAVAREVQVRLNPEVEKLFARQRKIVPQAYEAYLKGRYFENKLTEEALNRSIQYFNEAIALQPDYAAAYAGLSDSHTALEGTYLPPQKTMPQAKASAEKAMQLDESIAEAHVSMGRIALMYDWDWAAAERHFKRALEINPSSATAHTLYSSYLVRMNRPNEALSEAQMAQRLDPLSLGETIDMAWNFLYTRRFDLLTNQTQRVLELEPTFAWAHSFLGWASARTGMPSKGLQHMLTAAHNDNSFFIKGMLGEVYTMAGDSRSAEHVLGELKQESEGQYVCPHEIGALQAALKKYDQAFDSLEQAYQVRSDCMPFLVVDPRMDAIRSDPRFQRLLKRIDSAN